MNFNLPQINQQQFTEMAARLPDQVLVQLVQQARAHGRHYRRLQKDKIAI